MSPWTNEPVMAFSDQDVGECADCGFDDLADTIVGEDNVAYWICPDCGQGNARDIRGDD